MMAPICSTSSPPLKRESVNSGQEYLQPSHIPVSMDTRASNRFLEMSVLSAIEQDMQELLQYITSKHERLVMTVKNLTAQHEPATMRPSDSDKSVHFEYGIISQAFEPFTVLQESGQSNVLASASWTPGATSPISSKVQAQLQSTILKESDQSNVLASASWTPGATSPLSSKAQAQLEPTILKESGQSNVLASAPWTPIATSPISSKAQAQLEPSDDVDEQPCQDKDVGPERTVSADSPSRRLTSSSRRLTRRSSAAMLHWWNLCCKSRKRRSAHLRESLMNRSNDVDMPRFDGFVGTVIISNAIIMTVEIQWHGYLTSIQLGLAGEGGWTHAKIVFEVLEHVFTAFFIFELLARVSVNGPCYFGDLWNLFDVGLVLISIIDLYILHPLGHGGKGNLTFLRFARILKFMRVLRIVRVMKLFSSLRVLGKTIISSFSSLVWSMVLLGMIMGVFGMLLCQFLRDWILDEKNDSLQREWVFNHYGSSSRAFFTMFEATLSGCWPNYVKPLVEISHWYAVIFMFYVSVVVFAIIRIITALFLKETLQNANDDADMMINEQLKKKQEYLAKLAQAFEVMDESGDGTISYEEFESMLENPGIKAYLSILDLEVHETETLFRLLDGGDGLITYSEFIAGVLRMKGQARSIDLICLQRDMSRLHEAVMDISEHIGIRSPGAINKARRRSARASRAARASCMQRALDLAAVPPKEISMVPLVSH